MTQQPTLKVRTLWFEEVYDSVLNKVCHLIEACSGSLDIDFSDIDSAVSSLMQALGYELDAEVEEFWRMCFDEGFYLFSVFRGADGRCLSFGEGSYDKIHPLEIECDCDELTLDKVADLEWKERGEYWMAIDDETYYFAQEDPEKWLSEHEDEEEYEAEDDEEEEDKEKEND